MADSSTISIRRANNVETPCCSCSLAYVQIYMEIIEMVFVMFLGMEKFTSECWPRIKLEPDDDDDVAEDAIVFMNVRFDQMVACPYKSLARTKKL